MDAKTYTVKTKNGVALIQSLSLEFLESRFEFTLNDIINAENLKPGEELSRRLKVKTNSELYHSLVSGNKNGDYLVTISRDN